MPYRPPTGRLAAVLHAPAGHGKNLAVIFCHGFRGSKDGGGRAAALAARVAGQGFANLRFDFTPLGLLSAQVDELRAVVDYCRRNVSPRIILFGRSMGGSAALVTAADELVAGLCLWATPHDLRETFRLSLGDGYSLLERGKPYTATDQFGPLTPLTPDFLRDFDRFDLLACAGRLKGHPLLVVHGENDEIVPLRQAGEIFACAAEPKKLLVIPGGDHRFLTGYDQAAGAVLSWLAAAFPQSSA